MLLVLTTDGVPGLIPANENNFTSTRDTINCKLQTQLIYIFISLLRTMFEHTVNLWLTDTLWKRINRIKITRMKTFRELNCWGECYYTWKIRSLSKKNECYYSDKDMFNEYIGINFIILTYTDITMLRRLQTADIHENGKTNIRHLCQRSIVFSTVLKKNPFTYGQLTPG